MFNYTTFPYLLHICKGWLHKATVILFILPIMHSFILIYIHKLNQKYSGQKLTWGFFFLKKIAHAYHVIFLFRSFYCFVIFILFSFCSFSLFTFSLYFSVFITCFVFHFIHYSAWKKQCWPRVHIRMCKNNIFNYALHKVHIFHLHHMKDHGARLIEQIYTKPKTVSESEFKMMKVTNF